MTIKYNYVFPDEYEELLQKRKKIEDDIVEQGQVIWEVTTQSSETWHDNPWFDEAQRVIDLLSKQYKDINEIIKNTKVVIKENLTSTTIKLWSKVTVEIAWLQYTYEIGGINWNGKISYHAPLAKAIIGKEVWDAWQFTVWKNTIEVTVISID